MPTVIHADCLDALRDLPDNSVDAVITDPPYGLSNVSPTNVADTITKWASGDREYMPKARGFMGSLWDGFVPPPAVWDECLRVLKPGGHMAVFSGARTQDLMGISIRLAGFEIRDSVMWVFASGFPKSHDVSKGIDKARQGKGEALRFTTWIGEQCTARGVSKRDLDLAAGTSDMGGWWTSTLPQRCAVPTAEQWAKIKHLVGDLPDWASPLIMPARQPGENWDKRDITQHATRDHVAGEHIKFDQRSSTERERRDNAATDVSRQWEGWGTALKPAVEPIIIARKPLEGTVAANVLAYGTGGLNINKSRVPGEPWTFSHTDTTSRSSGIMGNKTGAREGVAKSHAAGRWPANVVLDPNAAQAMDKQSGVTPAGSYPARRGADGDRTAYGTFNGQDGLTSGKTDSGGASRFFHTFDDVFKYQAKAPKRERPVVEQADGTTLQHSTVKPLSLMVWLVGLLTPPGGTVLDPFAGSGTTLQAARDSGFESIGIEAEADYIQLIHERLSTPTPETPEPEPALFP